MSVTVADSVRRFRWRKRGLLPEPFEPEREDFLLRLSDVIGHTRYRGMTWDPMYLATKAWECQRPGTVLALLPPRTAIVLDLDAIPSALALNTTAVFIPWRSE